MSQSDAKNIDTEVTFEDGSRHFLADLWKNRPLVLVFLRHLG